MILREAKAHDAAREGEGRTRSDEEAPHMSRSMRLLALDCHHSERARLIINENAQPDLMSPFPHDQWRRLAMIDGTRRACHLFLEGLVEP
jgi:hypothetical protein